ncbi:MAG: GSCFA domain-containing protein [Pseudomonadota bacterium]
MRRVPPLSTGNNDVLDGLRQLYALLTAGRTKPLKFLVTVSPVGLVATFRDQDVLVANCYSKSVQRAAVEAFVAEHDAHYFPSYEYVTLTDRKFAWSNHDFRHVRAETVDRIIADVLREYVGESAGQSLLDARGRGTAFLDAKEPETAIKIIETHFETYGADSDLMWIYARALRDVKRFEDAIAACRKIVEADGFFRRSAARSAIFTARQIKDEDTEATMMEWYRINFPDEAEF